MGFAIKPLNIDITAKAKFRDVFSTLKSDLGEASSKVGTLNNKLGKTSAMLAQKSQELSKTGKNLRSTGKNLSLGLTAPLIALGTIGVSSLANLEEGMKNVQTLSIGENRIKSLTKDVDEMSVTFAKSTDIMTSGLYEVVSAFGDTEKAGDNTTEKLRINAEAAAAGQATVLESVKLTSAVTKAYGDTTDKAVQSVADMAFKTVELGQTNFPELASSITKVTSKASELGIQQKGLFGIMATATGVTGNASEVTTQLKGVMTALMTPTKNMTELYKKLGVEGGKELISKTGGIAQAMKLIVDNAKKTKTPLQSYIGSQEGVGLALALTGKQYDNLIMKTKAMGAAQGSSAKAFKIQSEGYRFQVNRMKQEFLSASRGIGEVLIPILTDLMVEIRPLIKGFRELGPGAKKFIVVGGLIAAALGPVIIGLGFVASGISSILGLGATIAPMLAPALAVFAKIGVFFSSLPGLVAALNPVGLVIGAFAASFTLAIIAFKKFFTNIQNSTTAPKWIKNFANDWLRGLGAMKEGFANLGSFVSSLFSGIWSGITSGFKVLVTSLETTLSKITSIVPDWVKESVGIDVSGQVANKTTSEEITKMQSENFITKTILEKQRQDVNVNFGGMPQGSTVESEGDNIAFLNMGYAQ